MLRYGRFWLVAVIIGVVMTLAGIKEAALAFGNRTQIEMSLSEFIRARPDGRWVKLTGCNVAYGGMVYRETIRKGTRTLSDVSVPVYADDNVNQPVKVVLCVADRREKQVVQNFRSMGTPTETIEGVIRGGMFYSGMNEKLQKLAPWKLAGEYVIIDEGRKPSMRNALIMLGIGVGLLGWMGFAVGRRFGWIGE